MNCPQAHNLFDAHQDGHLSGTLLCELEAHLLHCPACRRAYQVRLTVGEIIRHDRSEPVLDAGFADRVLAKATPSQVSVLVGRDERAAEPDAGEPIPFAPASFQPSKVEVAVAGPERTRRTWLTRWVMPLGAVAAGGLLFAVLPLDRSIPGPATAGAAGQRTALNAAPLITPRAAPVQLVGHFDKAMQGATEGAQAVGWMSAIPLADVLGERPTAVAYADEDSGPI